MSAGDDRPTAVGLARYATEYYDSAIAAHGLVGRRKGYDGSAPAPVMFLMATAIELALRAYLRHRGSAVADLERAGHDLMRLWFLAVDQEIRTEASYDLTEDQLEVLDLLNDLHTASEVRYIITGARRLPVFGPLKDITEPLIVAVCSTVGYTRWRAAGMG